MKQLRDHQKSATSAIACNDKGIINHPTGTGKSLMQSRSIVNDIIAFKDAAVYVILSPRILLSNQLLNDVRNDLLENKMVCQYLAVNSDMTANLDADEYMRIEAGVEYRETPVTVFSSVIRKTYEKAQRDGIPMVISSTYHSAIRIVDSGIPVKIVHCDEAHNLVNEQFNWIVGAKFPAENKFFFTATLRNTPSADGIGMNNEHFGGIIDQSLPVEMIVAGEIVRPRMHIVDLSDQPQSDEADGLAIAEAFVEHNSLTKGVGAKLLVVAKGTSHLDDIVKHAKIQQLMRTRPMLKVFDISSEYGPRVDGVGVKRGEFLETLKGLTDGDEAIIVHIDILAEGIDVPGITGIMPMNAQGPAKFRQTLGRATRLHTSDRTNLYNGTITSDDINEMVKPYAYIVIPAYGNLGDDLKENIREMVSELRTYDFNPSEDIVIKEKRGKVVPVLIGTVTSPTRAVKSMLDFAATVLHEVEEEEIAFELLKRCNDIDKKESIEETIVIGLT